MDESSLMGEIRLFAGNFAPVGWMFCDGQLLQIRQYSALFTLLQTRFGGDGQNTFALPDLNGRIPVGMGTGPGLTPRAIGDAEGDPAYTLNVTQLPRHTHAVFCNTSANLGTLNDPNGNYFGAGPMNRSTGQAVNTRYAGSSDDTTMLSTMLSPFGASAPQAISNIQPILGLNFIICIDGYYPDFGN